MGAHSTGRVGGSAGMAPPGPTVETAAGPDGVLLAGRARPRPRPLPQPRGRRGRERRTRLGAPGTSPPRCPPSCRHYLPRGLPQGRRGARPPAPPGAAPSAILGRRGEGGGRVKGQRAAPPPGRRGGAPASPASCGFSRPAGAAPCPWCGRCARPGGGEER